MTIDERVIYIYNEARKNGVTHQGAIGLLANLKGETSDFDPMSLETLYRNRFKLTDEEYVRRANAGEVVYNGRTFVFDSAGFGIAQWTWWSRKKGLLDFAKSLGKSVGDLDVQVEYMFKEMRTNYTKTWKVLTTTNDYREAVKICVNDYEKPANAQEAIQTRTAYAAEFLTIITDQKAEQEELPIIQPETGKPTAEISKFDRRKLVQMALSQVGYREKRSDSQLDDFTANAGTNNYTKYARDLDQLSGFYNGKKQGFAWCDMFVDWCFVECFGVENGLKLLCQKQGGAGAGCTYSMQYFQAKGQFVKRSEGKPEVGDPIFFGSGLSNSGHTGIVYAVDNNRVYTVEGNTTDSPSVVAEGTSVLKKSYALTQSNIIGYGRPLWNDGYTGNGFEIVEDGNEGEKAPVPTPTPEVDKTKIDAKMPTLRQGSYGEEVRKAQKALIAKGYSCGAYGADGSFGSATLSAVNSFRRAYGLSPNGIIDNEMWVILLDLGETLKSEMSLDATKIELKVLKSGDKGEQVKSLQILLRGRGYSVGSAGVDGDFGNGTFLGLKSYQKLNRLTPDGICGNETWEKLIKG